MRIFGTQFIHLCAAPFEFGHFVCVRGEGVDNIFKTHYFPFCHHISQLSSLIQCGVYVSISPPPPCRIEDVWLRQT